MDKQRPNMPAGHLSDDDLARQLRDIRVPDTLRDELLCILDQSAGSRDFATRTHQVRWRLPALWSVVVAAAILAAVTLWQFFPATPPAPDIAQRPRGESNVPTDPPAGKGEAIAETQRGPDEYRASDEYTARTDALRARIAELELAELIQTQRELRRASLPELSPRERVALAYAMSGEMLHRRVGPTPVVQDQLQKVVREFPATQGSELALQVLSK
jgi:hypothetical protein